MLLSILNTKPRLTRLWKAGTQHDLRCRRYRRASLQAKLIQERLSRAAQAGCDMATADTEPGSASQRNYEKLGFRVAYTRVTLIKPE